MKSKRKTRTKALSWLLSLALVLGLFPSMSLTAYATEELLTTITATGKEQASYSVANVATVSFSYTAGGSSAYLANWGWWGYGFIATVTPAEGYTITKCVFYDDANRTATDSEAPFVVETTEEDKTPKVNGTPILADQSKGIKKIEVYGYAAPETPSIYTITIPSTLTVANSGWNATGGISATGTLASGKKLTVTASSANSFKLKSGNNEVGYTLATASTDTEATTSWEFTELSNTAATQPMGIIVENYDNKPAGTYQDTVTFTAAMENAGIPVTSVTINNAPAEALFVNSTGTLTATVLPNDATDKTVTWSSDNPNHVKIDAATGEYIVTGVDGYGSATITATATNGTEDTSDDVTATCTITGKVTYTSLSAGTVLHVGDTFYAGKVYFNTTPAVSFQDSNGVITLVENNGCYKFQRGSNGTMPNVTAYKIKDNTDGIYIVSGSGTSTSDKFVLSVHTRPITFTVKRVGEDNNYNYTDGNYTVAAGTTWQQFIDSGDAPACLSILSGVVWHDMNASLRDCGGTRIANVADKKRVKPGDAIIDGATYGCSDYLGYQDHD